METPLHNKLSRRERQIMDVLYRLGEGAVADVVARIPDAPAYNSVRVTLGILEKKGFVTHYQDGPRYIYTPVVSPERATQSAVRHLLKTFFEGSPTKAILTLLDMSSDRLTDAELEALTRKIQEARAAEEATREAEGDDDA